MTTRHATLDTPIGPLTLVADGDALTGLYFPGHWHLPDASGFGPAVAVGDDVLLSRAAEQLGQYFRGERTAFDLPTRATGDAFRHSVWALLERIPYGRTTTYGALAAELGDPSLARAVGTAVGRNPLSIVVPCHRVVGSDGSLTGYAGGLDRKRFLLDLEAPAADAGRLF